MSFQERVSFPIKAQSTRSTDEEEAFLCSSLVKEKTLTTTPVLDSNINHLDLTSTDLLKKFRDEMMLEIQRQNDKIHDLQDKNEELTKQLLFSNPFDTDRDAETIGLRSNILRSSSAVTRSTLNIDADGEQNFSLPKDTFSLMMVSNPFSGPWLIGLLVYLIQMALFIFLCVELFTKDKGGILAQFSVETSTMLSVAEFLVLITIFLLQSDLVEATRCLFVLEDRHVFHLTCGHYIISDISSITSSSEWWKKKMCFTLPNVLKLSMAIVTILASVCVTLQSASVLELLKDFSALMIVNEIDNHVFELFVENGLCGLEAKKKADEVSTRSVKVDVVYAPLAHPTSKSRNDRWFRKDSLLIFTSYIVTLGMWIAIFVLQRNGTVEWATNFPGCKVPIKKLVGDGKCDGREYNTEECKWDGEDCIIPAYPKCHAHNPSWIGDGHCHNNAPYNTTECGRDGGDCIVPGYPDCHVDIPSDIGNGVCDRGDYNTEKCGWDGGDCNAFNKYPNCSLAIENSHRLGDGRCDGGEFITEECGWDGGDCEMFKNYPNCAQIENPSLIGNGKCDGGNYNTEECGWDGGDCFIEEYPDCHVGEPEKIGDGTCHNWPLYNTAECGWEGGDCDEFNKYPNCTRVKTPSLIGNEICDGGEYNTEECGWDGGDCIVDGYPDCHVKYTEKIADGTCHNWIPINTKECGWDGGDCILPDYPDCHVFNLRLIGNGECNGVGGYNTAECGWDGRDCEIFNLRYPNCDVNHPSKVGDNHCDSDHNTEECGWDGGDCLLPGYPHCHVNDPHLVGDGKCDGGVYNTTECGWDKGDCLQV